MNQMKRREVLSSIEEAVSQIKDGMTVGLSGMALFHEPMALIRAVIRKGVKDLTLVAIDGGMGPDMLIGAGCVRKLIFTGMTMQNLAPIPPNFRHAVEAGELEICELDFVHFHAALKAACYGTPYLLTKVGIGTDLPKVNPFLKEMEVDGKSWIAVPPLELDAYLGYGSQADPHGNVIYKAVVFEERELPRATRGPIIVQVEEVIPNEHLRRDPRQVILCQNIAADYVVEVPYGAHPEEGQSYYMHDAQAVAEYVEAAEAKRKGADPEAFKRYLDKYVFAAETQEKYLELSGGITRMLSLRQSLI